MPPELVHSTAQAASLSTAGQAVTAGVVSAEVAALTGLVLWWSLKGRGKWGAVVLLLGGAAAFTVYYWLVP